MGTILDSNFLGSNEDLKKIRAEGSQRSAMEGTFGRWREAQRQRLMQSADLRLVNYLIDHSGLSPRQKKGYLRLWESMALSVPFVAGAKLVFGSLAAAMIPANPTLARALDPILGLFSPLVRLILLILPFTLMYRLRINALFWVNFISGVGAFIAVPSQLFSIVFQHCRQRPDMSFKAIRAAHGEVSRRVLQADLTDDGYFSKEELLAMTPELTFRLLEWRVAQNFPAAKRDQLYPDDLLSLVRSEIGSWKG